MLTPVAEALRDRGDEPVCVRWRDGGPGYADAPAGVRVVQVDVPPARSGIAGKFDVLRQLRAFSRAFGDLIGAERPDVVHANFVLPGAAAVRAAKRARFADGSRPRVVLTRHELFSSLSAPLRALDRATRGRADAVTFVSRAVARSYGSAADVLDPAASGAVPREVVVYNGIDFAAVDAAIAAAGPRDVNRIVCAGRLVPVKGQATLLRAFAEVSRDRPDARLELIGEGPDRGMLGRLAAELGVSDRASLPGWRPRAEVLRAFAEAGCVAVPSDGTQEGFGLTLAEAAACGASLAVSDIPVFREVLGDAAGGATWFRPGDAAGCAAAVRACLDGPAPGGGGAAAGVRGRFSVGDLQTAYLAVYDAAPPA